MNLYEIREQLRKGATIYTLPLEVTFYARVSTSSDEQLNSIANQISYFEQKIQQNPLWTFVPGYIDEGISGISTQKREQFNRMIADAKRGKFNLILTKEISRFARNTIDSLTYVSQLLQQDVGVYFETDNLNTLEPDSDLRLTIMSSIAQEEVRKLSERVKFGHRKSIENGKVLGNSRIFGYDHIDCKLVINQSEAEMVHKVFTLYAQGISFRQITRYLYEAGYRNRNGNPIHHNTLIGILTNPKYKGYYCGGKVQILDYKTKKQHFLPQDRWLMYKDESGETVPAIVEEELWEKANQIYKLRSKQAQVQKNPYQRSLYSGKLMCMEHSAPFYRNSYTYKGIKRMLWYCKHKKEDFGEACVAPRLYEDELETIITAAMTPILQNRTQFLSQYLEIYREVLKNKSYQQDMLRIQKQIEQINARKNKLLDLSLDGKISNQEFGARNDAFNHQLDKCQQELEGYQALEQEQKQVDKQVRRISKVLDTLLTDNQIDIHLALELIDKIWIGRLDQQGNVDIQLVLKTTSALSVCYNKQDKIVWSSGSMLKKMMPKLQIPLQRTNRRLAQHTYNLVAQVDVGILVG